MTTTRGCLVEADHSADALVLADVVEQAQHAPGRARVEAGHGLVGEDEIRLLRQRPGDTDTLLHAAAEGLHAIERAVEQAHAIQTLKRDEVIGPREREDRPEASVIGEASGQDVPQRGQPSDELVLLEDHRGSPAVLVEHPRNRQVAGVGPHPPRRRSHETVQTPKERGFSSARHPEKDGELARSEGQRHLVERDRASGVGDADVRQLNHCSDCSTPGSPTRHAAVTVV